MTETERLTAAQAALAEAEAAYEAAETAVEAARADEGEAWYALLRAREEAAKAAKAAE